MENVISIGKKNPLNTHPDELLNYECYCLPSNYSKVPEQFNWTSVDKESCQVRANHLKVYFNSPIALDK